MAKKKKNGGRQGMVSKAINIGLIALGFSRVIEIIITPMTWKSRLSLIRTGATFGLSEGKFDWPAGLAMYTPGGAAIALGGLKSYLLKKFPVRR